MLEAWVVKVVLQWHTETYGVGFAALLQFAAVSVLCACCVLPAMVSSAVIGLCSNFLQTEVQNMVSCTAECMQH